MASNRTPGRPSNRMLLPAHVARVAAMLFDSRGYAAVTMEEIAASARVSKRTLYKYFACKEALLERMLEDELARDLSARDLDRDARAGFRAGLSPLLHASARWCEQHADVLLPYIRYKFATFDPAASGPDRGLLPLWIRLIRAAQQRGELAATQRPEQLGTYFHYLYLGALMRWLTVPRIRLAGEFDTMVALFVEGAGRRRPGISAKSGDSGGLRIARSRRGPSE